MFLVNNLAGCLARIKHSPSTASVPWIWCLWPLVVVGCAGVRSAPKPAVAPELAVPAPYVRVVCADSNLVEFQIASRQFRPISPGGLIVWLTGVSHVGASNYYAALQTHLDTHTRVLFEGISDGNSRPAGETGGALQAAMAASLGLVFQLDAIRYDRPGFLNCDLTLTELRELIERESSAAHRAETLRDFENLVDVMEGSSWLNWILQFSLRLLATSPKLQALGRLALIDLLAETKGDPSSFQGLPPGVVQLLDVLVRQRNARVLTQLRAEVEQAEPGDSVAVFYGVAHMPDLEEHLCADLGYRPSDQTWFTAFSVDLARTGVTPTEREYVSGLIRSQLIPAMKGAVAPER